MTLEERKLYAERLLEELLIRAPLRSRPILVWKAMRVSAGMTYYRTNTIGLSSRILDTEDRVRDTLVHEFAHLVAFERHGQFGAGHGRPWKEAMLELGADPKVRHGYEVQRNDPRQRVVYRCSRCGIEIARKRRLPRRRKYVHVDCGGGLSLVRIESVEAA